MPGVNTKKENSEPFLLWLRTAFHKRIIEQSNGAWISSIDIALANAASKKQKPPKEADPQGEFPFEILNAHDPLNGVIVQHNKGNTSFAIKGKMCSKSINILLGALKLLSELNCEKALIEGVHVDSNYEISFDLHIEDISQLQMMLHIANEANIQISGFYLNGKSIDPKTVEEHRKILRDNPIKVLKDEEVLLLESRPPDNNMWEKLSRPR